MPLVSYKFDPSGVHPDNRVAEEDHTVIDIPDSDFYLVIPRHGPFFSESMDAREPGQATLVEGPDYKAIELYERLSEVTGKGVYGALIVRKPIVGTRIRLTYQAIGGTRSYSNEVLRSILDDIGNMVGAEAEFDTIIDKPKAYPPSEHDHDYSDLIGMNDIHRELLLLNEVKKLEKTGVQIELEQFIDHYLVELGDPSTQEINAINTHAAQTNNPHGTTKAHVGLSRVDNYGMIPSNQFSLSATDKFLTPALLKEYIESTVMVDFQAHVSNSGNPHAVTPNQLGAYSSTETFNALNGLLDRTGISLDADRLNEIDYNEMRARVHFEIDPDQVTEGVFPILRLSETAPITERSALSGNREWRSLDELINPFRSTGEGVNVRIYPILEPMAVEDLVEYVIDTIGPIPKDPALPNEFYIGHGWVTYPLGFTEVTETHRQLSVFIAKRVTGGWEFLHHAPESIAPFSHTY